MPVFRLDIVNPVAPTWQETALRTGGWVRAACELEARRRFGKAAPRRNAASGNLAVFSPWYDTRLTNCRLDESHEDLAGGIIELMNGKRLTFQDA